MRASLLHEDLQITQPSQNSAMWGRRQPRQATTWPKRVQLWWSSRNCEGAVERTTMANKAFLAMFVGIAILLLASSSAFAARKQQLDPRAKVSPDLVQYFAAATWDRVSVVIQYVAKPGSKQFRDIQQTGGTVKNRY